MKSRKAFAVLTICALPALTILGILSPRQVLAQPVYCINARLRGTYGYQNSGFRSTQAPLTPFNDVRMTTFEGNGTLQGHGYLSEGGVVKPFTTTGTYTVASDCTVTITNTVAFSDGTASEPSSQFGVIVDGGRKILEIQTQSGRNESGFYERVN